MASAAVSTNVAYNAPVVATQCGIVYCSPTLDDFLINCTACSQEFNLLSCNLFIKHVKECLDTDIPNQISKQNTSSKSNYSFAITYLPAIKDDKPDDCVEEPNFDPLLPMKMEIGEMDESADLAVDGSVEDVDHLSDYKDEDDLSIDKIARRTMVEEIINEYRKHPLLWDESLYRTAPPAEKSVHYKQISDVINLNFKTNFTESEMRKQILNLRCGYRRVLKRKDKFDRKPILWYFHKLAFIDGTFTDIQERYPDVLPKEEMAAGEESSDSERSIPKTKKVRDKVPHLSERNIVLDIINRYKKHSILWNPASPGYKNNSKRTAALCRMASFIQKKHKRKVTAQDINSKIETLRSSCRRQRQRTKDGGRLTLWYYDKMSFVFDRNCNQAEDGSKTPEQRTVGEYETDQTDETSDQDSCDDSFEDYEQLNDTEIVLGLIEEYKKHPCLWNNDVYNSSSRSYRYLALQAIKNTVNANFNKAFTEDAVRNKIRLLRSGYRSVLHSMSAFEKDPSNVDKKFDTSVNFFDSLSFIGTTEHDTIITRQKKPRSSKPRWPRKFKKENENQMSDDSDEEEIVKPEDLFDYDKSKPYKGSLTKNKELLTFIIEEYKKHTCLWSKRGLGDGSSSRRRAYGNMVTVTNNKFGTTFTDKTLTNEIKSLRYSYSRMLRGKKDNPHYKTKMWYADLLSFTEVQAPADEEDTTEDDTQLDSTFSGVGRTKFKTEEHVFAIIDLYKAAPILWDTNHSGFMSRNERRKHFNNIKETLSEKHDYHITFDELKYQIRYLRVSYFRSLRNEIAYKEGDLSKYAPKSYFFDRLSFLRPFAKTTPTTAPLLQVDSELDSSEDYTFLTENNELMMSFIQLYQEAACLWDQNHKDMHNPSAQSDAYERIINMFQLNGVTVTREQVISAISFLHATVVSTQKASDAYDMNGTNVEPVWFYEHLKFLGKIPRTNKKYCNHCDQYFRTVAAYEKHKIQIGDYPFKCSVCGEGFLSRPKYDYHKILHREPHKCDQCDFQAHCKQNFKVHMLRHQGITPYGCEHCHKRFVTTNELNRHLRTHTGEKPYICDICGKNLSSSTEFNRHMKRHRNQRDHKCEVCAKAFFTHTSLRDHMTSHSEERKHICGTCGAAFKRKKTLYQHEALHAEKKKHKCKICGQLFAQKAGVYSHMKSHGLMLGNSEVGQLK